MLYRHLGDAVRCLIKQRRVCQHKQCLHSRHGRLSDSLSSFVVTPLGLDHFLAHSRKPSSPSLGTWCPPDDAQGGLPARQCPDRLQHLLLVAVLVECSAPQSSNVVNTGNYLVSAPTVPSSSTRTTTNEPLLFRKMGTATVTLQRFNCLRNSQSP